MAKARLGKELHFQTPNEIGMLAQVSSALAEAGLNINALSAYGDGEEAHFMIIADNNEKAKKTLLKLGFDAKQREVAMVELKNAPGALSEIAKKLAAFEVDLDYCYCTAAGSGKALFVFNSSNNAKAVKVLS